MLAREQLPFIGVLVLLENGCHEVWLTKDRIVIGFDADDSPDRVESFRRIHANNLARRFAYSGTAKDRNQHAMTGRVC
jgi:hypothetical protein